MKRIVFLLSIFLVPILSYSVLVEKGASVAVENNYVWAGTLRFDGADNEVTCASGDEFMMWDVDAGDVKNITCANLPGGVANPLTADLDTGGYDLEGTLRLDVDDDGTEDHIMTSAGRVGIGTTAPSSTLDIDGDVTISAASGNRYMTLDNASGSTEVAYRFQTGSTGSNYWWFGLNNADDFQVAYGTSFTNGGTAMAFDVDLNVGIGTVSPLANLHIGNTDYVDITDGLAFGDGDTGIFESGDDALNFIVNQALFPETGGSAGVPDFFVSGYARFDGPVILYDNLYATQFLQIYDNFGLQLGSGSDYTVGYHSASDTFRIADGTNLGSNIRLLIDSTGQVGIGTTAPSTALDVTGTATADYFVGDGSGLTGISGSGEWSDDGTTLTTLDSGRDVTVGGTLTTETLVVNGSGGGAMVMAYGSTDVTTTGTQVAVYGKDSSVYARKPSDGAVKDLFKDDFRFALGSPTDADAPFVFKAQNAITVTDIHCIVDSGTSVVIDVQECTSTGASCTTVDATITCDSDGAEDDGTLTNATIDAGDWVKLDIGTVTGTVGFMTGTVYYTE